MYVFLVSDVYSVKELKMMVVINQELTQSTRLHTNSRLVSYSSQGVRQDFSA